jgi:hypothetical protein
LTQRICCNLLKYGLYSESRRVVMPNYLYLPVFVGERVASEGLPKEFEGPTNQVLARQQAERNWGPGRLFLEIENPEAKGKTFSPKNKY